MRSRYAKEQEAEAIRSVGLAEAGQRVSLALGNARLRPSRVCKPLNRLGNQYGLRRVAALRIANAPQTRTAVERFGDGVTAAGAAAAKTILSQY